MHRLGRWVGLFAAVQLILASAGAAPAEATQCRAIEGGSPALAAIDAETRLRWLDRRISVDATRARIWAITWGMAYGTITIVELALLRNSTNTGDRAEKVVGASSAFIGVLAGAALPLKIMSDQAWWEKHFARSRSDDPCALLNTLEMLFIRDAESEAFGVGPLVHVGNFAINIAAGLILGLGYGRWSAFGYTSIVGIGVGEVQAATQPTDAIEDLRMYRRGELAPVSRVPRLGYAVAPMLRPDGGGAMLTLSW
ncbi:MAG: hypothetical protein JWN44_2959 [Myxococcales bacterium]|nr:hypothetical protein [Myxococcales bacterium]